MPTGVESEVESPTTPGDQMNQNQTPLHNLSEDGIPLFSEDMERSYSERQVDGVTDEPDASFERNPKTAWIARVQGIAWLRAMLNDPNGYIAEEIFKTQGFKGQHSSNERCRTVRALFTGEKVVDNKSVDYVLATWCMLGGAVPTIWKEPREKQKSGAIKPLTTWAKEILGELDQLWLARTSELKHCKDYGRGIAAPTSYNLAEAMKELYAMANRPKQNKKKPPTASSSSNLMKRAASSPRQSPAIKRLKTTTTKQPNEVGEAEARNIDVGTPNQRDKQSNESVLISKTPPTKVDPPRGGCPRQAVPRDSHQGEEGIYKSKGLEKLPKSKREQLKTTEEDLNMWMNWSKRKDQQLRDQDDELKQKQYELDYLREIVKVQQLQLEENEEPFADATSDNSSDGIFVHQSKPDLEVKIDELETKIEELTTAKHDLQRQWVSQHEQMMELERQKNDYKSVVGRLELELKQQKYHYQSMISHLEMKLRDQEELLDFSLKPVDARGQDS